MNGHVTAFVAPTFRWASLDGRMPAWRRALHAFCGYRDRVAFCCRGTARRAPTV